MPIFHFLKISVKENLMSINKSLTFIKRRQFWGIIFLNFFQNSLKSICVDLWLLKMFKMFNFRCHFCKTKKTHITLVLIQQWSDLQLLRYGVWQTEISDFDSFFTLLTPKNPQKSEFLKNEKTCWRYNFTQVYQKSGSYDVCFLRYGVWQT